MPRPIAEIEADLATARANLNALLDPNRADRMKHGERELSRARSGDPGMITEVRRQISFLERELARAQGRRPNRAWGV